MANAFDNEMLLCPVHARLDEIGKLKDFDNCIACIRVQRDELLAVAAKLPEVLTGAAQILNVVRGEWGESWSDWDQSILDGISELQREEHELQGAPNGRGLPSV